MKRSVPWMLLGVVLTLGAVCLFQARRLAEHKAQNASLSRALEAQVQQVIELQASKEHLNRERGELLTQVEDQARKLSSAPGSLPLIAGQTAPQAPGEKEADKAGFGKFLSKMLDDPETKEMFRNQQQMMMDLLYAPLIKRMGLSQEEADKFKGLLTENAMKGTEKASALFGGTDTNRTEALGNMAAENKVFEGQLKELLGETRYAQYKDFQETAGERMQLSMFKQQSGGGDLALTEEQTDQLLTLMKEEKKELAAAGLAVPGVGQDGANMQAMLAEDQSEVFLQAQESINERVYERAKSLLSQEQLSAFGRFQTNQMQMMRMGMTMARKFMGPASAEPAPRR